MNKFLVRNINNVISWTIILSALYLIIVVLSYIFAFHGKPISTSSDDWGTFGDFIGGTLNPVFSLLALFSLLATIALQSHEMELTREELKRAASAQEKTESVLNEQTKTQIRQQFESTFFSLLDQHNKSLERISTPTGHWTENRSDFDVVHERTFHNAILSLPGAKAEMEKRNALCGHYFRMLYQLLKFIAINHPKSQISYEFDAHSIENTPVSPEEKTYSNIVRSFIDYKTTQLLAINCYCETSEDTYWKYKLLVERYAFFEHMPFVIDGKSNHILEKTKTAYKNAAFGKSDFMDNTTSKV